jgi:hypothetical protein
LAGRLFLPKTILNKLSIYEDKARIDFIVKNTSITVNSIERENITILSTANPAHVNFFKHAIKRIKFNKNHLVFVTCLRRSNLPAIVRDEIEGVDITYIARHRGSVLSIIFEANILKFIKLLFLFFLKRLILVSALVVLH